MRARMWKYHLPGLRAAPVASFTDASTSLIVSGSEEGALSQEIE